MYKREIPAGMAGFLAQQQFAVLSTEDGQRRVWASLLAGAPGILEVRGLGSIALSHAVIETELPLNQIQADPRVGIITIDFSRRIRVRVNGNARIEGEDVVIAIEQLYGNCSQYIQKRVVVPASERANPVVTTGNELSQAHCELIGRADTFFVASRHPKLGADASHRGGMPGFIQATSPTHLVFPDYAGNNMFNTLGNLAVNPAVGLLFVDFDSGRTLQVSGRASIDWNYAQAAQFNLASQPKAERVIGVEIDAVREVEHATSLRYRLIGYSPTLG
jgi:hypothetical protein